MIKHFFALVAIISILCWTLANWEESITDLQGEDFYIACEIKGYDYGYAFSIQMQDIAVSDSIKIDAVKPFQLSSVDSKAVVVFRKGFQEGCRDVRLERPNRYDQIFEEKKKFVNRVRNM